MPPRSPNHVSAGRPVNWPELDLLRSLAATFMVLNHAAVRAVGDSGPGLISALGFIGSFAPVLFFFLTGLGYGVQSVGRPGPRGHSYVLKVLVLLAADAMMWARPGTYVGLDFLGFIGLSMLLLEWVRRTPRSGLVAAILAAVVFAAKFAVGQVVKHWIAVDSGNWLGIILGISYLRGVSYLPCPWLAYPLIGYVLGRVAAWRGDPNNRHTLAVLMSLLGFAVFTSVTTCVLVARGAMLFRWGLMSVTYFVASLAVLASGLALVVGISSARALRPMVIWVALSGVRSFAIVPLHFALLDFCDRTLGPIVGVGTYTRTTFLVLILSFAGSALVPLVASRLNTERPRRIAWSVVWAGFAIAYLLLTMGQLGGVASLAVRTFIQLSLCVLLSTTARSSVTAKTEKAAELCGASAGPALS